MCVTLLVLVMLEIILKYTFNIINNECYLENTTATHVMKMSCNLKKHLCGNVYVYNYFSPSRIYLTQGIYRVIFVQFNIGLLDIYLVTSYGEIQSNPLMFLVMICEVPMNHLYSHRFTNNLWTIINYLTSHIWSIV